VGAPAAKRFRVREAQAHLGLTRPAAGDDLLPMRYQYLAVEAFERGDLSEGQLARFLRVDRVEARSIVEKLSSRTVVSDEGVVEQVPLAFGDVLPPSGGRGDSGAPISDAEQW
jgi:hypothetical protein